MRYIGIDGGGTKTTFSYYEDDGKLISTITLPSAHILSNDKDICIKILKEGVNTLDPTHSAYVIAGLAGYGKDLQVRKEIEDVCQEAFYGYQYIIENDINIASKGALDGKDGIVIIAGTGSIALATINHQQIRCGGWGYQLDDKGSAYYIGKELLFEYCKQVDGRSKKSLIYSKLKEELKIKEDYEVINYINSINGDRSMIAALAAINYQCALLNDQHAINIYNKAAKHLALLIKTLSKNFNKQITVSYIGGVFKADKFILTPLNKELENNDCNIIRPINTPEYGAYLIGKEKKR